jgi:hypothetical protein
VNRRAIVSGLGLGAAVAALLGRSAAKADHPVPVDLERCARAAYEAYGTHGTPYAELAEWQKDIARAQVRAVLAAAA